MLEPSDFAAIIADITLKNGWEIHLREDGKTGRYYLQIQFDAPDNEGGGEPVRQHCRKWILSEHMCKSEVVRTAHWAFVAALLHEADEWFEYKDVDIYTPHYDVDSLAEARKNGWIRTETRKD